MIEQLMARLSSEVSDLAGRVESAAELADLTRRNALPQHTPAAHLIPLGLVGRAADAGAGAFTQMFEETFAVILTIRNHTPAGRKVLADLRGFLMRIVNAVAGWAPGDQVGVFRLARASLVSSANGAVVYQIDFAIDDQLRIIP